VIIGVAGLGSRGRAIGNRLRSVGLRVAGFDEDVRAAASSGLRTVGSSERLAKECEVELVACDGVPAEHLIQELLEFQGISSLTTIALCGALEPRRVQQLAVAAAAKGIAMVDAPIDGGEEAIASGRAVIFAGGTEAAVDGCRELFQAFGTLVYVGEAGSGQIARTVNDLLRWANVLAIHDAFSLVRTCGADPSPIRDAVLRASGSNRALQEWGRTGIAAAKQDIQAALLLAQESGAKMPFLEQLDTLLERLDPDQMAGLFNLGVVDLSKPQDSQVS
jgi:3-hydroxyisobutyrate dehydrogenase